MIEGQNQSRKFSFMGKQLAREIFPWDLLEARLEFYFHSQLECRYFIFMPSSRILLGEQSCYQILLKFSAPPLLLCQNVNGFIWEIVFIQQTFISLEFICLISVTSQIRFKLNLLGKNLVTERWQTTKYLSSFQQQPNFFQDFLTQLHICICICVFVFVCVCVCILFSSKHTLSKISHPNCLLISNMKWSISIDLHQYLFSFCQ